MLGSIPDLDQPALPAVLLDQLTVDSAQYTVRLPEVPQAPPVLLQQPLPHQGGQGLLVEAQGGEGGHQGGLQVVTLDPLKQFDPGEGGGDDIGEGDYGVDADDCNDDDNSDDLAAEVNPPTPHSW